MKTNIKKIKFLVLAALVAVGAHYASAFPAPSNPPANNVTGLVDISNTLQRKGSTSATPGILLDIDDSTNTNDTFSTNALAVFPIAVNRGIVVGNDTFVNSLPGPKFLCSDSTGTLQVCP